MPSYLQQLVDSLRLTWSQLQYFLLGAVLFLTLGWLVARLARAGVEALLRLTRVDVAADRAGVEDFLLRGGVRFTTVTLIGLFVYWGVLLVAALATFNLMGLPVSTTLIDRVAAYLPDVLVALVIVVFGSLLARFVSGTVHTYLNNLGASGAGAISFLTQAAILAFVATLALEQLHIGGQVLVSAFQLAFGGLCLALALAFGLGGRDWAAAILERTRKAK
jgi:hypothetical protein